MIVQPLSVYPGGQYPAIMSLPYSVLQKLAGILDGAAIHNWRALVQCLPEYTEGDAIVFATEEQKVRREKLPPPRQLLRREGVPRWRS